MVGREKERAIMQECLLSNQSEFIAVLGRRRVGKTYLIRNTLKSDIIFEVTGIQNGTKAEQFDNFREQLETYFDQTKIRNPKSWLEAFSMLKKFLGTKKTKRKRVIFFDELPWLAEPSKAKFVEALGHFWNSWAEQNNIILVICGSAASWIVKNIVNTKGGLYNRLTKRIILKPFSLYETNKFLLKKDIVIDEYELLHLYMSLGGIPHYLNNIVPNRSIAENISSLCFEKTGLLHNEFENLYKALFANHEQYIRVIKALANSKKGLTRQDIIQLSEIPDGGTLTTILKDLVQCDFILEQNHFTQKKKNIVYRLIDEFSLFALKFMAEKSSISKNYWQLTMDTQAYKIWTGYAFENVCFRHQDQIVRAMNLEAIQTEFSSFYLRASDELPGTQIDMVLDRADNVINLFEIKFYNEPIIFNHALAQALRTKSAVFKASTKTRKNIFVSLISVFGTVLNKHNSGLLAHDIAASALCKP